MQKKFVLFCVIFISSLFFPEQSFSQVTGNDSLALVKLYDATGGDSWNNNTNWKSSEPVGSWYGITVSGGRVTEINLSYNNITGALPAEIGNLTALTSLTLYSNKITSLPSTIGNLTNLTSLVLGSNQLTNASIPSELASLNKLTVLKLNRNKLTIFPEAILNLNTLLTLYIDNNSLSSIPDNIDVLTSLETLSYNDNLLNGKVPSALGNMNNLKNLYLGGNQFTEIPTVITDMINLERLGMWYNQLEEEDLVNLGNLSNLIHLDLGQNPLRKIPDVICNLTNLQYLYLYSIELNDTSYIGNLTNLSQLLSLSLSSNQLKSIPTVIFSLTSLTSLSLDYNQLGGPIPTELGNLSNLQYLNLYNNNLEGAVPAEITNLKNLYNLYIQNNNLTDLPDLSAISNLSRLYINGNRFTFEDIEPNIGVAQNTFLYAPQQNVGAPVDTILNIGESITIHFPVGGANNKYQWFKDDVEISGATTDTYQITSFTEEDFGTYTLHITNTVATELELVSAPFSVTNPQLAEQDSLALVAIYNALDGSNWDRKENWLTASPISTWEGVTIERNRVTVLNLSYNNLSGEIPAEIGDLTGLTNLTLERNYGITGALPAEIGQLVNLTTLELGGNAITSIPSTVGNLTKLEFFEMFDNALDDGAIPQELQNCINIWLLNLSSNNFHRIPQPVLNMSNLSTLYIHNNNISSIPPDIVNMTNLEKLKLSNNNISSDSLAAEIGQMANLQQLYLGYNKLEELPAFITNMVNLTHLEISGNNLQPDDLVNLGNLVNLTYLSLGDLNLTTIPEGVASLSGLTSLALYNNQLTDTSLTRLTNLTNITYLYLGQNLLTSWPQVIFNMPMLNSLDLGINQISGSIPPQIGDLNYLYYLYLFNNKLSGAVPEEITSAENLSILSLYNNELTDLPDLSALTKLNRLKIENNKFTFEDIEPNLHVPKYDFYYAPQDSVGEKENIIIAPNEDLLLEVNVGGEHNTYQWYKNGNAITGATSNEYEINGVDFSDAGSYSCEINNTIVTDLTLYSRPIHVEVKGKAVIASSEAKDITPRTVVIQARVNPAGYETGVQVEYGLDASYGFTALMEPNPITGTTELTVSVFIPNLTENTPYHYRISAANQAGTVYTNDNVFSTLDYPDNYALSQTINLPTYESISNYNTTDYRIIGIPGSSNALINEFLDGELDKDWIVYWDNGAAGSPDDYYIKFDGSDRFKCTTGKAFFVLSKGKPFIQRDVPTAPINDKAQVLIPVHDGWNLITNPFTSSVPWSAVIEANDNIDIKIYSFAGSYSNPGLLLPYQGYYFYSPAGLGTLKIPYPTGTTAMLPKQTLAQESGWRVNIILSSAELEDNTTYFGVLDNAEELFKPMYYHKPRAFDGILNIYFDRPDWDEDYPYFSTDLQNSNGDNYHWSFNVEVFPGEKASMEFNGIDLIPEGTGLYLINRTQTCYQNLRDNPIYTFTPVVKQYDFEIVVGEDSYIREELQKIIPHEYKLGANFPNPFNPSTTIPIELPQDSKIELSVFDVLGRKITTIYNGHLNAGRHLMKWNVRNQSGTHYPSGVYFYRLTVEGNKTLTGKMILLK